MEPRKHQECRNYAPLDVVKGICHRTKERLLGDDDACEDIVLQPRCAHCEHFEMEDDRQVGVCTISPSRPMAYPALSAVTCESFLWRVEG